MKYPIIITTLTVLLISSVAVIIINSDFNNNEVLNPDRKTYKIPDWVKHNADWWSKDHIEDYEFSYSIEFLINEGIIQTEECVGKCHIINEKEN